MKIVMFALLLSTLCELTTALRRQHIFVTDELSWIDAQIYCRSHYADLSTVDSQEETTALNNVSEGAASWVGLKLNSTNNWTWSDGSNSAQLWKTGEPKGTSGDLCAALAVGGFNDKNCPESNPYFCYKWDTELIVVKENKSWEDALQYCRAHHTDLASLPTDLHLIQAKQTTAETSSVWTGLRFLAGSWFWLSDEDLGYLSVRVPACPANYTYCGSLNLTTQRWENRNCMEELNFVCY